MLGEMLLLNLSFLLIGFDDGLWCLVLFKFDDSISKVNCCWLVATVDVSPLLLSKSVMLNELIFLLLLLLLLPLVVKLAFAWSPWLSDSFESGDEDREVRIDDDDDDDLGDESLCCVTYVWSLWFLEDVEEDDDDDDVGDRSIIDEDADEMPDVFCWWEGDDGASFTFDIAVVVVVAAAAASKLDANDVDIFVFL